METFFDLRGLFIALLKRLKMIIVLTLILSIGWATLRFVPLAVKYISYSNITDSGAPTELLKEDAQPYVYQARRTIMVNPTYISLNNQVTDVAYKTCEAYRGLYQNREILELLVNEFFAEFQQDDIAWKKKLVDCNYRTRSVLNDEYTLANFYAQITVDVPTENIVNLKVHSNNAELSEKTVARFEELLTAYVADATGHFEHTVTVGQIGPWLPEPSQGLIPISNHDLTATLAAGEKPSVSFIVTQTVKGGIFGALAGIALSVVLAFFINLVSLLIEFSGDLRHHNKQILLVQRLPKKKRLLGFIDRWVQTLESEYSANITFEEGYLILLEKLKLLIDIEDAHIVLSSSSNSELVQQFAQGVKKSAKDIYPQLTITCLPCINTNHATIQAAVKADHVILIEETGKSTKADVAHELEEYNFIDKDVLGFILLT